MDVSGFRRLLTIGALALCCAAVLSVPASAGAKGPKGPKGPPKGPPASGSTVTSIVTGLDNPRDLTFGPGGRLYVAEAGHGGTECIPAQPPEEEATCVGFTSAISAIDSSGAHRVVSGLVSLAEPAGFAATGLDGIAMVGNGSMFGVETESAHSIPAEASKFLSATTIERARAQLGRLIQTNPSGHWKAVADVGGFDFQWTLEHKELVPDQFPDANPYGVFVSGGERWVVDAAANTLDEVRPNGSVRVVAFFPNPPTSDAVPTCLDRGPDGAFYVGELTGGGNGAGASTVWRVVAGQQPEAWATGLTAVTGCGFGSDGQFYAAEFSTLGFESFAPGTGALVRVPAHSSSPVAVVANTPGQSDSPLSFPGGFAAGPDGSLYVSNWSIAPANSGGGPTGEVVRIAP
jgi:hypothetical protein